MKNPSSEQVEQANSQSVELQVSMGVAQSDVIDVMAIKNKNDLEEIAKASPVAYDPNRTHRFDTLRLEFAQKLIAHYSAVVPAQSMPSNATASDSPTVFEGEEQTPAPAPDLTLGELVQASSSGFITDKPYHYPGGTFIGGPGVFYVVHAKTGKVTRGKMSPDKRHSGSLSARQDMVMLGSVEMTPEQIKARCDEVNQAANHLNTQLQAMNGKLTPEVQARINSAVANVLSEEKLLV